MYQSNLTPHFLVQCIPIFNCPSMQSTLVNVLRVTSLPPAIASVTHNHSLLLPPAKLHVSSCGLTIRLQPRLLRLNRMPATRASNVFSLKVQLRPAKSSLHRDRTGIPPGRARRPADQPLSSYHKGQQCSQGIGGINRYRLYRTRVTNGNQLKS